ncbi:MAG TPA: NifU family protein [Gaiellales bacterium]|jgi:Fe-S cluster biogenesis protein NfuA/nitrite reductase/ring-hydroxylating ferredoxin subunit
MASQDDPLARVQELTEALDRLDIGPAKGLAEALVGAVVDLYGEGLRRIMEVLADDSASVAELRARLSADGLVASIMLVHDLYPVGLEERVLQALASVRPYMESHGGDVELLGIDAGVARLRLVGHCHGCPASLSTLELAIKDALDERAPDLAGVEVEGLTEPAPAAGGNGMTPMRGRLAAPTWLPVEAAGDVAAGSLRTVTLRGAEIVVANVEGSLLAYRSQCPCCQAGLADATLEGAVLACAGCKHGYVLTEAGRAVGSDDVHLEPVPLLRRDGVGVAVAVAT